MTDDDWLKEIAATPPPADVPWIKPVMAP
jgi:hypothetical protein